MAEIIVKTVKNGPLEIWGGAKPVDDSGKEYVESGSEPLYLCRCGHSKQSRFATTVTKKLASKPNRQRIKRYANATFHYSNTPALQLGGCWSN